MMKTLKMMKSRARLEFSLSVALALAAPGLVACSSTPAPATSHADATSEMGAGDGTRPAEVAASDPAAAQSDEQVTSSILAKLGKDPDPEVRIVGVTTAEGVVTLTGSVSTPQTRNTAVSIADDTFGVVSVRDDLVVGSADESEDDSSP